MKEAGFKRVGIWVPAEEMALVKELRVWLSEGHPHMVEDLRQFFTSFYEQMAEDNYYEGDREFALGRLKALLATQKDLK
ncbi:hypothetical protein ACRAQ6_10545 [Erythrobacter sp. HA6-11]